MANEQVAVGAKAPDFELPDANGNPVKLSNFRGKKTVVLYFYPEDETSGCTAQACSFRDHYEEFLAAGAEVVGVSRDDAASHQGFAKHHRLPFVLLSDRGNLVGARYGVRSSFGVLNGRITFVIDRDGTIRMVFNSLLRARAHVDKALALVKELEPARTAV